MFINDDYSDYLIHLVGKNEPYNTFMSILSSGTLKAQSAFGFLKEIHNKKSICFSEIPPLYLKKLVQRRYNHGIAFNKKFLLEKGAQRVWYVEKDSAVHKSLVYLSLELSNDKISEFLNLAPFIDIPGKYGDTYYRFEWEREWRVLGNVSFSPRDVSFLIIPEDKHALARTFFKDAEEENIGPNYDCPYFDPLTNVYSK